MSSTPLAQGTHFTVFSSRRIEFFSLEGARLEHTWVVACIEIDPRPVLQDIVRVIEDDIANGKEHLIDHVLISPSTAVGLFLEGALPIDVLRNAREDDESIVFMMPLAGKDRQVKIQDERGLQYQFSTRDATGAIV